LGAGFLAAALVRVTLALLITAAIITSVRRFVDTGPWLSALLGCGAFPLLGILLGLVPNPRRSLLLRQQPAASL